jgi:outer membrane assembly lipoprotein YfiO
MPTFATKQKAAQLDLTLPSTDSKKQKSRMRKSTGTKPKRISSYRDMNYCELQNAKNVLITQNNITSAIKYLEQMIKLCGENDTENIAANRLEIADLIFKEGGYQKAAQRYAEFALLHPGNDNLQYALYQAIDSSFHCSLSHDRDQTKTEETLHLAENFLKQDHFTTYREKTLAIRNSCIAKLVESECDICDFYLKRGKIKPVEKRLACLRDKWITKLPSLEQHIIEFQNKISAHQDMLLAKTEKNNTLIKKTLNKPMKDRF